MFFVLKKIVEFVIAKRRKVFCKGLQNSDICKERDKKCDKNKEDPPGRITKTSATYHVWKQLIPLH